MQRQHAHLGTTIVHHAGAANEAGHTRDRHDVPLSRRYHVGQERLDQVEVAEQVDVDDPAQELGLRFQDGVTGAADAGIVDQDGRIA